MLLSKDHANFSNIYTIAGELTFIELGFQKKNIC